MIPEIGLSCITNFIFEGIKQYLSFKCLESEFKNPLLNGLQIASLNLSYNDIMGAKKNIINSLCCGLAVTVDDLLINYNITKKHYFTDLTFAYVLYAQKDNPISFIFLGLKYLQQWCTGNNKDYIDTTRALGANVIKNINNLEYISNGEVNIKSTFKQYIISKALVKSTFSIAAKPTSQSEQNSSGDFTQNVLNDVFNDFILSNLVMGVSSKMYSIINNNNNNIITSHTSLLKISSNKRMSSILNNIDDYAYNIRDMTRMLISKGGTILDSNALTLEKIALLNLRSWCGELLNVADVVNLEKEARDISSNMSKFKQSLTTNPRSVIERDGLEYFQYKKKITNSRLEDIEKEHAQRDGIRMRYELLNALDPCLSFFILDYKDIINKVSNPNISNDLYDLYGKIYEKTSLCSDAFKLNDIISNNKNLLLLEDNLIRLVDLYKFVDNLENNAYVNYYSYNGSDIQLKDIKIDINGCNKLNLDNLTLVSGNWYLLTGKSGCGKTTFMSALRGLPNFTDTIDIKGDIYYPKVSSTDNPKIYMLTQTNNFPYMVSIMEALLYPMITSETERQSYKTLVEELMLKMEGFTRNSVQGKEYLENGLLSRLYDIVNDITSETSGGQQKKMSITGMIIRIMKETNMLDIYNNYISAGKSHDSAMALARNEVGSVFVLIDETFNGLDSGVNGGNFDKSSKGLVLKTLKESLPSKAIVLSVEHQPQFDQYNARLHLNGDGTYTYTGTRIQVNIPTEYEVLDPLKNNITFCADESSNELAIDWHHQSF